MHYNINRFLTSEIGRLSCVLMHYSDSQDHTMHYNIDRFLTSEIGCLSRVLMHYSDSQDHTMHYKLHYTGIINALKYFYNASYLRLEVKSLVLRSVAHNVSSISLCSAKSHYCA